MEFSVDLRPSEYAHAMKWHQFRSTWGKKINDWIGWGILILAPITIALLAWQNALSIWFWPVAIVAILYSLYSTVGMRYQIQKQAATILAHHPALARTGYHFHQKGIHLTSETGSDGEPVKLFVPWKKVTYIQELPQVFLIFVEVERGEKRSSGKDQTETDSDDDIVEAAQTLVLPKRSLPDDRAFRTLMDEKNVDVQGG